jgi:hypothetical protein
MHFDGGAGLGVGPTTEVLHQLFAIKAFELSHSFSYYWACGHRKPSLFYGSLSMASSRAIRQFLKRFVRDTIFCKTPFRLSRGS